MGEPFWQRNTRLDQLPSPEELMAHLRSEGCTCFPMITIEPDERGADVRHTEECGFRRG